MQIILPKVCTFGQLFMRLLLCTVLLGKCVVIESWDIFFAAYPGKGVPFVNVLMRLLSLHNAIEQICGS